MTSQDKLKDALKGTDEVQITVIGRKSGREISNPVWFVQEGERLYLLPVRGSDSDWYKNARNRPELRLNAAGTEWTGQATPITDAATVNEVVDKFRAKHGAGDVQKYYSKLDVAIEVRYA